MVSIGVVALGVEDVDRAAAFWCKTPGYEIRTDGFGGWEAMLTPPAGGAGTKIALQRSETPPQDHPRLHLDLHVSSAAEQTAEAERLMAIGAERVTHVAYRMVAWIAKAAGIPRHISPRSRRHAAITDALAAASPCVTPRSSPVTADLKRQL